MKILHYSLGFPPYRSGGLTKYCMDLMQTQAGEGHQVCLLWPGRMKLWGGRRPTFVESVYRGISGVEIGSIEVVNPLPVPLDEGIKEVEAYQRPVDPQVYRQLLKKLQPDVIHVHTLMGLHRELIETAAALGIPTVFTTHDYFGLCPKVTFFRNGRPCDDRDCSHCVECNRTALSLGEIRALQSGLYRCLKDVALVKLARRIHRMRFHSASQNGAEKAVSPVTGNVEQYRQLREYYSSILQGIDTIHFNSNISKKIYTRYLEPKKSQVINITHRGIRDHRGPKDYSHDVLRIAFLSEAKPYKGFEILIQALDELWEEGYQKLELHTYSRSDKKRPYLQETDGFVHSDFPEMFGKADVLVAPSVCYETFGLTVAEALSYGVPVIVSENMGAQDLLEDRFGLVVRDHKDDIKRVLKEIMDSDLTLLEKLHEEILAQYQVQDMKEHWNQLQEIYHK